MTPLAWLRSRYQRWFHGWLARRIPEEQEVVLNRRRIFILPSRAGFAFLGVVALLWLVATNYQNNLVFAFAALLASMFVVAIFHSYANLSGLRLRVEQVDPAFAGHRARVVIALGQQGRPRLRDELTLSFPGASPVVATLPGAAASTELFVPAPRRGWLRPGRLTVESHYPLGLFRVWTHVLPACKGIVYPRPIRGEPLALGDGGGEGEARLVAGGSEDFIGLDKYRPGESLNRVAWKHQAQGRGMLSKQFGESISRSLWLDWRAFPGLDREARLSRLCQWLLTVSAADEVYGLRLPGVETELARGPAHRDRLLALLALFEVAD
ncbi:MAG: DUF58 domain-containing protein [Porticoccaceae bacterium]